MKPLEYVMLTTLTGVVILIVNVNVNGKSHKLCGRDFPRGIARACSFDWSDSRPRIRRQNVASKTTWGQFNFQTFVIPVMELLLHVCFF